MMSVSTEQPLPARLIVIDLSLQRLAVMAAGRVRFEALVSTARNGPGECRDSGCTPRGWHCIRARIGDGAVAGAVFRGRRPTGEIYRYGQLAAESQRDWILTRILWLSGREPGRNRLGNVDTMRRYIYIHGTPAETVLGHPGSHGCVRMANQDLLTLFAWCRAGDAVYIGEDAELIRQRWLRTFRHGGETT